MVQHCNLARDDKGVAEPLNETCGGMTPYGDGRRVGDGVIVWGVHRLLVGKGAVGASLARSVMDAAFAEPLVLVGTALAVVAADDDDDAVHVPWPDSKMPLAVLTKALPDNVMLMTVLRLTTATTRPPIYYNWDINMVHRSGQFKII